MAAGPISLAEDYLKATLAASATFRTLVEAEDAEAAEASIHNDALPAPAAADGVYTKTELEGYHPYALVDTDPDGGYQMVFSAVGAGGYEYGDSGKLILRLARLVPADTDVAAVERSWKNTIGQILTEMGDVAGTAGYLAITGMTLVSLDRFHPDNEPGMGDAQGATVAIDWGAE